METEWLNGQYVGPSYKYLCQQRPELTSYIAKVFDIIVKQIFQLNILNAELKLNLLNMILVFHINVKIISIQANIEP